MFPGEEVLKFRATGVVPRKITPWTTKWHLRFLALADIYRYME